MENLYLKKYKPKYFNNFYIDKDIILLLKTLIKIDNLNILFIGDSGVGKTSIIEATIREYYGIDNIVHPDILFINSLKEQGIQYYRNNLKTFCQTKCSIDSKKKKFIILDDIDMINEQSQQVFRNYIDKYSHNVNFLISCVNNQKVIDNIQSRTTIIRIKKVTNTDFKKIFKKIKNKENILIDEEGEQFLYKICNNSINKLTNYLQKIKLYNKKTDIVTVKNICTNISFFIFEKYTTLWMEKNYNESIKLIMEIYKRGYSVLDILDNYFSFIKITNMIDEEKKYKIIKFICKYIENFYTKHEDEIELSFFTNNLIINLS
tara:strand:+ start:161 stop:1117 length:957 start_codon:yes stop_codon:yes gene_type:complete